MWLFTDRRLRRLAAVVLVALVGAGMSWAWSREDDRKDLKTLVDEAKQRAAQQPVTVKPGTFSDPARVEAAAAAARARGEQELERRARDIERQASAPNDALTPDKESQPSGRSSKKALPGRVVVALSSSMPETMLREYMRQLHQVPEGIAVLRGFVGGARTVAPTGKWVEAIRRKQVGCRECAHFEVEVVVDPLIYRMLDIQKVPAVVYLPGVQDLRHCDAESVSTAAVAYGATSIHAALVQLTRNGVAVPGEVLKRFGGG